MEFISFYKKKRESTESSPSERHVGHYKVVAGNEYLDHLHTVMINIGIINEVALSRWENV